MTWWAKSTVDWWNRCAQLVGCARTPTALMLNREVFGNSTQTKKTLGRRTIASLALKCDRNARKRRKLNQYVVRYICTIY